MEANWWKKRKIFFRNAFQTVNARWTPNLKYPSNIQSSTCTVLHMLSVLFITFVFPTRELSEVPIPVFFFFLKFLYYMSCNQEDYFLYYYKCGHRNVLSKRQVWMSIFHIINFKKKKFMDTGVLDFFNKKLILDLFLLKVRSCVFISNFHHSPPPPPKGYKIVSLIIN
jgi:hypothetical protein